MKIKRTQNRNQTRRISVLLLYLLFMVLVFVACDGYIEEPSANQDAGYYTSVDVVFSDKQITDLTPDIATEPEPTTTLSPVSHNTIAAGVFHSLVIVDGKLWAWGFNAQGQLGDGTTEGRSRPVQVGTDTDWASVVVSNGHTVALKTDGSLWACAYKLLSVHI